MLTYSANVPLRLPKTSSPGRNAGLPWPPMTSTMVGAVSAGYP